MNIKENKSGDFIAKKSLITLKLIYQEDQWVLIITAFNIITINIPIQDIINLIKKKP